MADAGNAATSGKPHAGAPRADAEAPPPSTPVSSVRAQVDHGTVGSAGNDAPDSVGDGAAVESVSPRHVSFAATSPGVNAADSDSKCNGGGGGSGSGSNPKQGVHTDTVKLLTSVFTPMLASYVRMCWCRRDCGEVMCQRPWFRAIGFVQEPCQSTGPCAGASLHGVPQGWPHRTPVVAPTRYPVAGTSSFAGAGRCCACSVTCDTLCVRRLCMIS